ncbi:hypothetical protein CSIM01_03769 [Colletotrichum simmondsii]|uniref:Uncharacterized protein n=1 Tax=Colletotrichum simmondsii TaxID=703756 RepID=A0A135TN45_9PEZI|nr:hypothetical protein CSIM01_03769 [Colletotrichum simmondsii]
MIIDLKSRRNPLCKSPPATIENDKGWNQHRPQIRLTLCIISVALIWSKDIGGSGAWASASSGAASDANAFAAASPSASADICNPSLGRLWISCASALMKTMEKSMGFGWECRWECRCVGDRGFEDRDLRFAVTGIEEIDRKTAWGRDGKLNKAQKNPD